MKALVPLLFLGIAVCLFAQENKNPEKMAASPETPKPFVKLPNDGFKSVQEMESCATGSLHGGGSVQEMTIGGQPVWVLKRSISLGGSTSEITFFKKIQSGYVSFFGMPLSVGEFRVEQLEDGILLSRFDYSNKKWVKVLAIYQLP